MTLEWEETSRQQDLVRRAVASDAVALDCFMALATPVVQARVARVVLSRGRRAGRDLRQEVADLVQDVFVSLFQNRGATLMAWQPEKGASLKNFIGLIAHRHAMATLRSRPRSPLTNVPVDSSALESHDAESGPTSPEARAASRELVQKVLDGLRARLSPLGVEMFYRLFVDCESTATIVLATGMSEDAVYQWRARIVQQAQQVQREVERPRLARVARAFLSGFLP